MLSGNKLCFLVSQLRSSKLQDNTSSQNVQTGQSHLMNRVMGSEADCL